MHLSFYPSGGGLDLPNDRDKEGRSGKRQQMYVVGKCVALGLPGEGRCGKEREVVMVAVLLQRAATRRSPRFIHVFEDPDSVPYQGQFDWTGVVALRLDEQPLWIRERLRYGEVSYRVDLMLAATPANL
jgi:hypothetical protein